MKIAGMLSDNYSNFDTVVYGAVLDRELSVRNYQILRYLLQFLNALVRNGSDNKKRECLSILSRLIFSANFGTTRRTSNCSARS